MLAGVLCFVTLAGEKTSVPWQQRVGPAPLARVKPEGEKPNFWFEHAVFLPETGLGPSLLSSSSPSKGRPVHGAAEALPAGDRIHTRILRLLLRHNQKPTAGSQWSDGLSHNTQLAQRQVRRALWKPIQTEPGTFSRGT